MAGLLFIWSIALCANFVAKKTENVGYRDRAFNGQPKAYILVPLRVRLRLTVKRSGLIAPANVFFESLSYFTETNHARYDRKLNNRLSRRQALDMSTFISFESSDAPPLPIHRFTVQQYHLLGETGVLTPEDRVELLEGWIVEKMNQKPAHGFAVRYLNNCLNSVLSGAWLVQCQLPITTDRSEPEPDLAVVRGVHTDYRERHPSGNDCELVIEVADTSVMKDRAKASIYARSGVREYWIVNLIENQLEVYSDSDGTAYKESKLFQANETIETAIGQRTIKLDLTELFVG